MVEQQDNQLQFLVSDLGTRLREVEERTSTLKERTQILGSNLLETKETVEERVSRIEKQNAQISQDLKKINSSLQGILSELNNFVRKDEIILIERMLKDFQPLEFARKQDLDELASQLNTNQKNKNQETIK